MVNNSITQLRSEEWRGPEHVVGSDAMPASTQMRADDAQYDNSLRGALPRTEGWPTAGIRTANEQIIRGGGQAWRPEHDAWAVPDIMGIVSDSSHFLHFIYFSFSHLSAHHPDPRPATAPGDRPGWPASATFRTPPAQGRKKGVPQRKAIDDEGNAAR